jgi:hypothetical protein
MALTISNIPRTENLYIKSLAKISHFNLKLCHGTCIGINDETAIVDFVLGEAVGMQNPFGEIIIIN